MSQSPAVLHFVDQAKLPRDYPTHLHTSEFWEALGRTVATFGMLEKTLSPAIFAFTGMRKVREEDVSEELKKWEKTLKLALSDTLGSLIEKYGKAVRDHGGAKISNFDDLLKDLAAAAKIRNVLCHASWGIPNEAGQSLPLFINRHSEKFETLVDIQFLDQTRRHVLELICAVINSVTTMGWQFPGSKSPGIPLW